MSNHLGNWQFPKIIIPFYTPKNKVDFWWRFLHSFQHLLLFCFSFLCSHPCGYAMVYPPWIWFAFPWRQMMLNTFHVLWSLVWPFVKYLFKILLIFNRLLFLGHTHAWHTHSSSLWLAKLFNNVFWWAEF